MQIDITSNSIPSHTRQIAAHTTDRDPMTKDCNLLAVVEFIDQIPAALSYASEYEQACFFACTAPVAQALQIAGVNVCTPTNFTDDTALQRYGENTYQIVDQLCTDLDDFLAEHVSEIRENGIRPFSMEHYRLKAVYDGEIARLTELLDAFNTLKPKKVLAFVNDEVEALGLDVDVEFTFLYGNDAARICRQHTIESHLVLSSRARQRVQPKSLAKSLGGLQRLGRFIRQYGIRKTAARLVEMYKTRHSVNKPGPGILVLQSIVADGLLADHVPVWRWRGIGQPIIGNTGLGRGTISPVFDNSMRPSFEDNRNIRNSFLFQGIDWFDYAKHYLDAYVEHELPACLANCRAADEVFRTVKVGAVTATNLGSGSFLRHVASRSLKAGVPVVVLQHGAIGFHREFSYHYQEFRYCSHYLIYAPGCAAHFAHPIATDFAYKIVGSPSLDKIKQPSRSKADICQRYGLDATKPLVVFPTVVHAWRNRQLVMATENEFRHTEIQSAIMNAMLADPRVQIIVKGNMGDTADNMPSLYSFESNNKTRVRCVTDLPFSAFLDAADCFIMDMPSTMLLEAMTRDRRVYAFNQCYIWELEGLELLDEGVHLERESLSRFCQDLQRDIQSGAAFLRRAKNGPFVKHFGDPFEDGKSTERVVGALVELTQKGCWAA